MGSVYYTLEEISKNNGKDGYNTWIIIKNGVYDVTDYLKKDEHPGGVDAIQEYAGKNATKAFSNIGHSLDAKNLLKQFMIGELAESESTDKSRSKEVDDTKIETNKRSCIAILTCGIIS